MTANLYTSAPIVLLGGTSLILTVIATVLHALYYTSSKPLSLGLSRMGVAVIGLSAVSCFAIVGLLLLWMMDIRDHTAGTRKKWKTYIYGLILAYLLTATGITAGGIGWSTANPLGSQKRSLMIARCVLWTCSVLGQGVLVGYISVALTRREKQLSSSLHELRTFADQSNLEDKNISQAPSFMNETRRSSLDPTLSCELLTPAQKPKPYATSWTSHRYSGRTLCQPDWKQCSSDPNAAGPTYPTCALTRNKSEYTQSDRDSCTVVGDDRSELRNLHRSSSELKQSVDSLLLQSLSGRTSPAASSTQLEEPSKLPLPPKLRVPDESNIHPLFRSDSPSPPPTAMPGTIVVASPAAGQTISVKTLERVRSTHSLRSHTPRSRSPLVEMMDRKPDSSESQPCNHDSGQKSTMPNYIMAAQLRMSIARYEKKYELNESPDES